jgi:cold shock CspA family protein
MRLPLQITFRNLPRSEAVERAVRERAERLDRFCQRIMACRVVVETRHRRHHGNLYHLRIDLTLPGQEIVAGREPSRHQAYEDVYVAVRDAFDAARRRLEDYARRHDGRVKAHEPTPRGRITRLDPDKGCGFLGTPDGREIYFHRNSVLNEDFDRLVVGGLVRYHEEAGEEGPQASTVHAERKLHAFRRHGGSLGPEEATREGEASVRPP